MSQGGFTYGLHTGKLFCLPCAHFSLEQNLNLDFSSTTGPLSLPILCLEYSSPSSNWLLGPSLTSKARPALPQPSCPKAWKNWQPQVILGTARSLAKVWRASRRKGGWHAVGYRAVCSALRCIGLRRTGLAPALLR